jgi:hypothetical protein
MARCDLTITGAAPVRHRPSAVVEHETCTTGGRGSYGVAGSGESQRVLKHPLVGAGWWNLREIQALEFSQVTVHIAPASRLFRWRPFVVANKTVNPFHP